MTIGKEGFQYLLRRDIGDTNDTNNVIRLIRDTASGDYGMLARVCGAPLCGTSPAASG